MSNSKAKSQESTAGGKADDTVDVRVIKALGHPLRQRILQELNQGVASPSEIAAQLDEPLSNVSYHVKILAKCEAIELVRTAPVRGALEHFYRATMRARLDEKEWAALPDSIKQDLTGQTLSQIWEHVSRAAGDGGFNDPKSAVVWIDLELDDEAYSRLADEVVRLVDLAAELQAESFVRLAKLDDAERDRETHRTGLAQLLFHRS